MKYCHFGFIASIRAIGLGFNLRTIRTTGLQELIQHSDFSLGINNETIKRFHLAVEILAPNALGSGLRGKSIKIFGNLANNLLD